MGEQRSEDMGFDAPWIPPNLMEVLPTAVCVCNRDGLIVAFNRQASTLWGRTPELGCIEERFCGALKLFGLDGRAMAHSQTPMATALKTKMPVHHQELVIGQANGERIPVVVNVLLLLNARGEQVGAVSCFQDMTEVKRAEKERAQCKEALNQSRKMEAISQLSDSMAHDFGNMMLSISTSLELMQACSRQLSFDDMTRYLRLAIEATQRATGLTRRWLTFAHHEPMPQNPIDMGALLSRMSAVLKRTVGPHIDLQINADTPGLCACIDAPQLESAIVNLCVNARDAMPLGGRVVISVEPAYVDQAISSPNKLAAGEYTVLSVSDTGLGMSPEVAARAFEPFFSTKPHGTGAGLGLAMVYGFVQKSGGHAQIHSVPQQGTTVCLYLPCQHGAGLAPTRLHRRRTPTSREGSLSVLVVDDEPTARLLLVEGLKQKGLLVHEASHSDAALDILKSPTPIDMLISDVYLPQGKTGWQLVAKARTLRPKLKALLMSSSSEDLAHAQRMGPGVPLVSKPFRLAELVNQIDELLAETV